MRSIVCTLNFYFCDCLTCLWLIQVSSCLQILINLDVLEIKISKVYGEIEKVMEREAKAALDVKVQATTARGMSSTH